MKLLFLLALSFVAIPCLAEDWVTTDGKTYGDVKVIRSDSTSVTILTQDGEVTVPLATLPPEIQKRFNPSATAATSSATPGPADEAAARAKARQSAVFVHGLVTYKDAAGALLVDCNAPSTPDTFEGQSPAGRGGLGPFSEYQNTVAATGNADAAQGRRAYGTVFLLGVSSNIRRGDTVGITAYPAGHYTDQRGTFHAYTTQLP